MKKIEINDEYSILFYGVNGKFELVEFDKEPKQTKFTEIMIDTGSRGHEPYRPPAFKRRYYTSNDEKSDWFEYLEKALDFIKDYCKQNKLTLLENIKLAELNLAIKNNKNWYKAYIKNKIECKKQEELMKKEQEKKVALHYIKEVLAKEEEKFIKDSIGFQSGEVIAYINEFGDILIKNIELSEYYEVGNLFK